ncbi:carbohydrate ABC transporter permease [Cryptosporangium phraense]|uniref:Carbohydrate ABC transporter permease n=1 Tax=Cryptosporangium phraense TaxID=2593070 RepID=A0A545ARU7_9ACTN|nr:carbohydrate ABC transporter permease [Cryptosporangium phraense]TQS44058.1 carbohydrate ABC transporter permease [Cryptosporangium phraense]
MGRRAAWHAALIAASVVLLGPVVLAVLASFKTPSSLFEANPLPVHPTLGNYTAAVARFPLGRLLVNTAVTSAGVMLAQLVVAVPAAYGVVRFSGRAGRLVLAAGSLSVVVPVQAYLVPQFLMVSELGWQNTFAGMIVPQLSGAGIALLLLHQHLRAIPPSLGEAAALDGASSLQTLWYVVLPLLRPTLVAVGILVFITTWNEYLWPLLSAPGLGTVQTGLALFGNTEGANPGPLLAAATLATLPVLAGYVVAARRVTNAFMHAGLH